RHAHLVPTWAGTELLGSSATPRHERLAAFLAMPFDAHSATLIWRYFRHKVGCLRLQICALTLAISAVFAFGRAVHRGSTARREHAPAARACCLLRTGIPLTLAPSAPLAFGRAVHCVRAERHKHGAADCACRLWAGLLASLSPACGFCRASARVGTEAMGPSPTGPHQECLTAFLAMPLVA